MRIQQYYLACLSHASYMIVDEGSQTAAVVDPQRDVQVYLDDAAAAGCVIRHVLLTHFHADFLAGHIELRDRAGAVISLGRRAQAEFPFQPLADGDRIEFGQVRLEILETPGHTPEGISILVYDLATSDTVPRAALTGDTLFVGDVGRPDLLASLGATADELADMLYDSLVHKLLPLPDATLVYPAHGAGSMCGRSLSKETVSTIGEQKKFNYALQPMSREEFKRLVTAEQPEAPAYFTRDALLNRQQRDNLEQTLARSLRPMTLDEVQQQRAAGAQLLDVREGIDFEGAHLQGAINIGLNGKYATWCGALLDHAAPIVVIADPGSEPEAVTRLGRIGFDNVAGYLDRGMAALEKRPELVGRIDRITAVALSERLSAADPPVVLDVRTPSEHAAGSVPGSVNLPLNRLRERLADIPAERSLVVHCEGGYRSAIAASLLAAAGRTRILDLSGGYKAWSASRLPAETAS